MSCMTLVYLETFNLINGVVAKIKFLTSHDQNEQENLCDAKRTYFAFILVLTRSLYSSKID